MAQYGRALVTRSPDGNNLTTTPKRKPSRPPAGTSTNCIPAGRSGSTPVRRLLVGSNSITTLRPSPSPPRNCPPPFRHLRRAGHSLPLLRRLLQLSRHGNFALCVRENL